MSRKRISKIRYCDFCGHPFGKERGPAAKTCSPECERQRNNTKEKARYERVKKTDDWKAGRADYLLRLKKRAAAEPDLAEKMATSHRAAVRRFRKAVEADPQRLAEYRAQRRQWHYDRTPEQRAARKSWYSTLSSKLKQLFLLDLRKKRALERLSTLAEFHVQEVTQTVSDTPVDKLQNP